MVFVTKHTGAARAARKAQVERRKDGNDGYGDVPEEGSQQLRGRGGAETLPKDHSRV